MILSMTGYGKASTNLHGRAFQIEARSLNSKYLDLNLKLPSVLRHKEIEIRSLITANLLRGKVDFTITTDGGAELPTQTINRGLFNAYYNELKTIADENGLGHQDLLAVIVRLPDVMQTDNTTLSDEEWALLEPGIKKALHLLEEFRKREGNELRKDMVERVAMISEANDKVEAIEGGRKDKVRDRISTQLHSFIEDGKIDQNRLEQEMIYYIEKLDVTEEIVRLRSHCQYFIEIIDEAGTEKGKKLGFMSQEMGREINTIGSKSNSGELQKLVVLMKEQLEKIKEQLNNIL
jgi:uncharacterized protein (TIGR00255 family)